MELAIVLVIIGLFAVGAILGRRIMATRGTIGAPIPSGTTGVVQATLAPVGTVLLGGETWTARTPDELTLERGTRVRLVRLDGLTAIVEPLGADAEFPSPPPTPPAPLPADRT